MLNLRNNLTSRAIYVGGENCTYQNGQSYILHICIERSSILILCPYRTRYLTLRAFMKDFEVIE